MAPLSVAGAVLRVVQSCLAPWRTESPLISSLPISDQTFFPLCTLTHTWVSLWLLNCPSGLHTWPANVLGISTCLFIQQTSSGAAEIQKPAPSTVPL